MITFDRSSKTRVTSLSATLGLAVCALACSSGGGEAAGGAGSTSGAGNAGGMGGAGSVTTGASSSSSSAVAVASSSAGAGGSGGAGGAGGSMSFVCDPPAAPGSLYELAAESYDLNDLEPVSMCKYRGEVALIVNTAAA